MRRIIDPDRDEKRRMAEDYLVNAKHNGHPLHGDSDKALMFYEMAVKVFEEMGDIDKMAECYLGMGELYYGRGNLAKAEDMFMKLLDAHQRRGDRGMMATAYKSLGEVYARHGNRQAAQTKFSKCLEICKAIYPPGEYKKNEERMKNNPLWNC